MNREEWRDVPGFDGLYMISSNGRVKSVQRTVVAADGRQHAYKGRILRQHPNRKGYLSVSLCRAGKKKTRDVHSIVCETFHGPRPEGREAAHRDGCNTNNTRENLAWLTPEDNHADRERHGNISRGEPHSTAMRRYWATKKASRLRGH